MRTILAALLMICPVTAQSGAWPRDAGGGFVSLSYELTTWTDAMSQSRLEETGGELETFGYTGLYAEFGLTGWLTAGLDIGEENQPDTRTDIVFLRVPISPLDWAHRFAFELGVGQREIPTYGLLRGTRETVFRPGLAWGYGFGSRFGNGWAGLDLKAEHRQTTGGTAITADFTVGIRPDERWLTFVQLQGDDYPGNGPTLRIVPTVVRRINNWLSLETAALIGSYGDKTIGLKTGVWIEF